MDSRKKAAQATIDFFAKSNVKSVSKNSHGPYSDSDTSSCEDHVVSLPSSTSLNILLMVCLILNLYILGFIWTKIRIEVVYVLV